MTLNPMAIVAARRRIAGIVATTPLERSAALSAASGAEVFFKLECAQITGSFKLRGATNALLEQSPGTAVVGCSAGNHALGLAHAAAHVGADATLVLPANASPAKIAALRRYPVQLVLHGQSYDEAEQEALRIARVEGRRFVSPYNDPAIIAGQGSVGVEIGEQLPSTELVLVPVGGGGLISGVALWLKALNPALRIIGVQPSVSATMAAALRAGHMLTMPSEPSLADGLAGGIDPETITFGLIQRLVADIVTVSERQIAEAMRWLLDEHHLVVEGSGAVGVAALLNGLVAEVQGRQVVVLLTGRNVATGLLMQVLNG